MTDKPVAPEPTQPEGLDAEGFIRAAALANAFMGSGHFDDLKTLLRSAYALLSDQQRDQFAELQNVAAIVQRSRVPESEREVLDGFTRGQLEDAFAKVRNPKNWKDPISATILKSELEAVSAAVMFFTGSQAEVLRELKDGQRVRIRASGYYAAVGA